MMSPLICEKHPPPAGKNSAINSVGLRFVAIQYNCILYKIKFIFHILIFTFFNIYLLKKQLLNYYILILTKNKSHRY